MKKMNKGYYSRGLSLVAILSLLLVSSCTYDYFEDETNYVVYVPKADKELRTDSFQIEDLSIIICNGERIVKERYSFAPFAESGRSIRGDFNFRLYPGPYNVYCFSNMKETPLQDMDSYSQAWFGLTKADDGFYKEPSPIYLDYLTPTIEFPGPTLIDTAWFEKTYVGRIGVVFDNLEQINSALTKTNIKYVQIVATGIGVVQHLSAMTTWNDTRSSRNDPSDKMLLSSELMNPQYKHFTMGIENYYFPSPDLSEEGVNEPIVLQLSFIGHDDKPIASLELAVVDSQRNPLILHMNELIVIEIDGSKVQVLHVDNPEDWNPTIVKEGNSGPGGGGIEI